MTSPTVPEVLRVIAECAVEVDEQYIGDNSASRCVKHAFAVLAERLNERADRASPRRIPPRFPADIARRGAANVEGSSQSALKPASSESATPRAVPPAEAGEPTLLPCPFCGGQAHDISQGIGSSWVTNCINCGASMMAASYPAVRGAWNRRAQPIPGAGEGRQDYWHYDKRGNWVPGNAPPPAPAPENRVMNDDQIKHMVDRFLGWRLPKPWHPDNGISYERPNYAHAPADHDWPVGTNLFDAAQADAMVRYMIEGLSPPATGEVGAIVKRLRSLAFHIVETSRADDQDAMTCEGAASTILNQQREIERLTDLVGRK